DERDRLLRFRGEVRAHSRDAVVCGKFRRLKLHRRNRIETHLVQRRDEKTFRLRNLKTERGAVVGLRGFARDDEVEKIPRSLFGRPIFCAACERAENERAEPARHLLSSSIRRIGSSARARNGSGSVISGSRFSSASCNFSSVLSFM